jgi:hypothetical protein
MSSSRALSFASRSRSSQAGRPDLDDELGTAWKSIGLGEENFFDEDESIDERLAAFLDTYHLSRVVDAFAQWVAAEDEA